ncbi:hypothetical protein HanPI659440_Chr07g0270411 [Helianthus annuus]|nr:hypothetical protein HanPI659440_Chr07g0270411 [Helianthus annuus]
MYTYQTNACCRPENAISGMISTSLRSHKGVITCFHKDNKKILSSTIGQENQQERPA